MVEVEPQVEVVIVRRGVGYFLYCDCPKSSVEVPFVGVICGQASGLKILLGEGGDVELGALTSKHILLFALDPLTLSLSLFTLCLATIHIVHS